MLRFQRPPKPPDFEKKVGPLRTRVKKKINLGQKPEFGDAWGRYKGTFALAQHGKCGYCEMRVAGAAFGDVEHFRPKGEIWSLPDDPEAWGRERPGFSSVDGRQKKVLASTGYWWLAYDWDNYLFSCQICNQAWKISYFPVEEQDRRLPPRPDVEEHGLLLNPYDGPDPGLHLRFGPIGEVAACEGSLYGRETIKTCGLDRDSLRLSRLEKARKAHRLVLEIREAQSPEATDRALQDFYELGRPEFDHAGMVRIVFEQECGVAWHELETMMEG